MTFFFFFKSPFPFLAIRLFTVPFGRPLFPLQFPFCLSQVMRRGSGALYPATHAHSTSHSQTYTTTFIHPWAPFPDGTRTRADLAVVAERVLIFLPPPYRQPRGDIHYYSICQHFSSSLKIKQNRILKTRQRFRHSCKLIRRVQSGAYSGKCRNIL
jgi:hypothetical protein